MGFKLKTELTKLRNSLNEGNWIQHEYLKKNKCCLSGAIYLFIERKNLAIVQYLIERFLWLKYKTIDITRFNDVICKSVKDVHKLLDTMVRCVDLIAKTDKKFIVEKMEEAKTQVRARYFDELTHEITRIFPKNRVLAFAITVAIVATTSHEKQGHKNEMRMWLDESMATVLENEEIWQ